MARYLSQPGRLHLTFRWSGQEWEEWAFSFPKFTCSHCPAPTSCLVDPPILPSWPISVYLKYDWQNTDNSPAPGYGLVRKDELALYFCSAIVVPRPLVLSHLHYRLQGHEAHPFSAERNLGSQFLCLLLSSEVALLAATSKLQRDHFPACFFSL